MEPTSKEGEIAGSGGLKPGELAPCWGTYRQVGPGGELGRRITALQGQPLPATPKKGMRYFRVQAPPSEEQF